MDPARVQRNLRDLVNLPGEVAATPGAKVGELAAAAAGQRAAEEAKAYGEESRIGLKELALEKQGEAWGREMDIGKKQAGRALIFAGIGTALKLGSAHLVSKKADEIVATMVGQQGIVDELKIWMDSRLGDYMGVMGKRKQAQQGAFGGKVSGE